MAFSGIANILYLFELSSGRMDSSEQEVIAVTGSKPELSQDIVSTHASDGKHSREVTAGRSEAYPASGAKPWGDQSMLRMWVCVSLRSLRGNRDGLVESVKAEKMMRPIKE